MPVVVATTQTAAPPQPQEESLDKQLRLLEACWLRCSSEARSGMAACRCHRRGSPTQASRPHFSHRSVCHPLGMIRGVQEISSNQLRKRQAKLSLPLVLRSVHAGAVGNVAAAAIRAEAGGATCGGPVECPSSAFGAEAGGAKRGGPVECPSSGTTVRTAGDSAAQCSTRARQKTRRASASQCRTCPLAGDGRGYVRTLAQAQHSRPWTKPQQSQMKCRSRRASGAWWRSPTSGALHAWSTALD